MIQSVLPAQHPARAVNERIEHVELADARWQAFLSATSPTLFQTPHWAGLIEAEYGFPVRVALALRDDEVVGGLPYAEVEDFRGSRRIAFPFADICEPLGAAGAWRAIEKSLVGDGVAWQIRSRTLPSNLAQSVDRLGVHQSIELPARADDTAALFHQKQRVNALRLERAGAVCRKVTDESFIPAFYELFCALRKNKFHLLPQSRKFFELLIARFFPSRGFALSAELDGCTVACMILLAEGDTLFIKYSASDAQALPLRPNNYLFGKAVEEAIAGGYRHLDLGISNDEGLIRFKEHLGARATPYYAARYCQTPPDPSARQAEAALGRLTEILTEPDVPLPIAAQIGAILYRYFV